MVGEGFVNTVDNLGNLQRLHRFHGLNEFGPKTAEQLFPFHFAVGNIIEEFLQLGGKVVFNVFLEKVFEKYGYNSAAVFGYKTQFFDPDIFSFLQNRHNAGIGGRTANAQFLKFFDQAGFRIARRRGGEMLFGTDFAFFYAFAFFNIRKDAVLIIFIVIVAAFLIKFEKTVKFDNLSVGAKQDLPVGGNCINDDLVEHRRVHLAGYRSFPNQFIKLMGVAVEFGLHLFGVSETWAGRMASWASCAFLDLVLYSLGALGR